MTKEDIQNFAAEQKEFSAKKKRIDRGKKILNSIDYINNAIEETSDLGKVCWIRKIVETSGGLDKDITLERNLKMFLTVLKEDYEKEFESL